MPDRKAVIDELNFLSGLLSERVRTAAAVILAFCWAFIVEGASAPGGGFLSTPDVVPPLLLAAATLMADFAQYLAGLRLNVRTLAQMERRKVETLAYDARHPLYLIRQGAFYAKMLLLAAALIWLLAVILLRLV